MIKFFRRARLKLLTRTKIWTYIFYGFGEVLLVMVGILLALQVNNWNEKRISKRLEKSSLEMIQKSLLTDRQLLFINIENYDKVIDLAGNLLDRYEDSGQIPDGLVDSLPFLMPYVNAITDLGGYQLLLSRGVDIIQNDSLRSMVTNYYENIAPWDQFSMKKFESEWESITDVWVTQNYYAERPWNLFNVRPYDREALVNDPKIMGRVYNRLAFAKGMQSQFKRSLIKIENMLTFMQEYLDG